MDKLREGAKCSLAVRSFVFPGKWMIMPMASLRLAMKQSLLAKGEAYLLRNVSNVNSLLTDEELEELLEKL